MNKNILIISASPRRGGNSDSLCDAFMQGALEVGHQVEKVFLKDHTIHYCTGCGFCTKNGYTACSQQDDMTALLDKFMAADVILMATPVYFYSLCAQMKTFMDRCCARYTKIINKSFYFILTAADENRQTLERTQEVFRGFLDCLPGAKEQEVLYATGVWESGDVQTTAYPEMAKKMGQSVSQ